MCIRDRALVDDIELSELSTPMPTNYFAYNFDHADKCLYIFSSSGSYKKPNETLVITKINISNWHIQQYEWVNTTGVNITTNGMRYAYAHEGYVYFKSYNSPYKVYKFEIGKDVYKRQTYVSLKKVSAMAIRKVPRLICSPLKCSRTLPTSWQSTRTLLSQIILKIGWMSLIPSPSIRYCHSSFSSGD